MVFPRFLSRALEWITVAVFSALVVNVLWGVATRYLLGNQARWSEELARLLMVWLAFLGAVLALARQEHLGVDLLLRKLHPDARRIAELSVLLIVTLFAGVVLGYGGLVLTWQRWQASQLLPALGISKAWFYVAVPVSGVLMVFASLDQMMRVIRGTPRSMSPTPEDEE